MQISSATIHINPPEPVELAGYRPYRGDQTIRECLKPLETNALYIKDSHQPRLLISYDLIWLGEEFVNHIKGWVVENYNLPEEAILLSAIHTHSAPNTLKRAPFYGKINEGYVSFLKDQTKALISKVMKGTQPSTITVHQYATGNLPVVNRISFGFSPIRMSKTCFNSPNTERHTSGPINILSFKYSAHDSTPNALVISMACHPVFNKGNKCSPDYPASIRDYFRNLYGADIPILFLQGFAGDQRPFYQDRSIKSRVRNALLKGRFKPDFEKDISHRESHFIDCFKNIIEAEEPDAVKINSGDSLVYKTKRLTVWDGSENTPQLYLQRWDITGSLSLVAVNAEVFSRYAQELKSVAHQKGKTVIPVGYANGMLGYLPDKEVLQRQCGYEYKSWHKFGLPAPFPYDIAADLSNALAELFE